MDDSFWNRFGLELILLTFISIFGLCDAPRTRDLPAQQQKHIDEEFRKALGT